MAGWLSSSEIAAHRPDFSLADAERLAIDVYGVEGTAVELPSDRDRNFRIRGRGGTDHVLKIVSAVTSRARVDDEVRILAALDGRLGTVAVPKIIPTLDGAGVATISQGHLAYLVGWIDGKPLGDSKPHTRTLLREIGRLAARIDGTLSGFDQIGPLIESPWDLLKSHEVVDSLVDGIARPERRDLVLRIRDSFVESVLERCANLPHQVVHNDLNDYNLLVQVGHKALQLSGVLDVGDAHHSVRVADPVIAAGYAALHWEDPIGAAAEVAGGYNDILPLSEEEIAVFLPLMAMRLCASVCVSAHRGVGEPDDEYVTISESGAWDTLERLARQPSELGHYRIREACGHEPCPESILVRRWIDRHMDEVGAVCRHDLGSSRTFVLDLSVGSHAPYVLAEEPVATKEVWRAMQDAGAEIGVGRYDEVRLVYSNELFEIPTLDGRVQRTVHIGADLFLPVGEEIRAVLDGEVWGLADNDENLSYGPTIILCHQPPGCPRFFTLYGHLSRTDLSSLQVRRKVRRGDVIGHIGNPSENGRWTPHLHFQVIVDMLGRESDFPGVCAYADRGTWSSISPNPYRLLHLDEAVEPRPEIDAPSLARERSTRLSPSLSVSYDDPLLILRGVGAYMFDQGGRRYLDCVNNVNHVGHGHPAVASAVAEQMRVLNTNTRYLHPNVVEYARRLTSKLPDPLSVCFFVNSGSEANDLALRLARAHTGRDSVVVLDAAYHGHLTSLIEVSPYKFKGPGGSGGSVRVLVADLPDLYRGKFTGPDAAEAYAASVRRCLESATGGAAALLCESMLSCGGQIELPPDYLRDAYGHARDNGAICIADEVQVGFGRVGSNFWGFETQGVIPDIVTLGKPIGNGHPLGAVVTTPEIAASFDTGMEYFNTYGGNPVSCAAGLAVLDVIERENLQAHAQEVGGYLKTRLARLKDRAPLIGDVRGRGLFLGVELVLDADRRPATAQAAYVINRARQLGVLLSTDGPDHNVLKIKPPLTFGREDADLLVATLESILAEDPAKP